MEIICLQEEAFYALVEQVVGRLEEKIWKNKISGFHMNRLTHA